jgi:hypothetical protein
MPDLIKTPLAGPNVEALPFIQPNSAADVVLALTADLGWGNPGAVRRRDGFLVWAAGPWKKPIKQNDTELINNNFMSVIPLIVFEIEAFMAL